MSRLLSKNEGFEKVFEAFEQINFGAFDANTIKQSMVEYLKVYHGDTFNDLIESSELVALMELFAYLGDLFSYRSDINAHENYFTIAKRKKSVLRLAKLISYSAERNLPARGLVKVTSVTTSEPVMDHNGNNLAKKKIIWDDSNNPSWKEQFILIMNQILKQDFGDIQNPNNRIQLDDILFEKYDIKNIPLPNGTIRYSAVSETVVVPMEVVPTEFDPVFGIIEARPFNNSTMTLMYGNDGLGDTSNTTGFFFYTKQGNLKKTTKEFDGVTPNVFLDIVGGQNINEIDVWVNTIDVDLNTIEEWESIDTRNSLNLAFNTQTSRKKYEIETLEDDNIKIVFGDGTFSDIPKDTLDIWYRESQNSTQVVDKNSVVNQKIVFNYLDNSGKTQELILEISLIRSLTNSFASETIENIRRTALSVYSIQDRITNLDDLNTFLLQDPSILKLKGSNRKLQADPKYIPTNDPSDTYRNIKHIDDDGVVYFKDTERVIEIDEPITPTILLKNKIEPLLDDLDISLLMHEEALKQNKALQIRTEFITDTLNNLGQAEEFEKLLEMLGEPSTFNLNPPVALFPIGLIFNYDKSVWQAINPVSDDAIIIIDKILQENKLAGWKLLIKGRKLLAHSEKTNFWYQNEDKRILDEDTDIPRFDLFTVLGVNPDGKTRDCEQQENIAGNINFKIIGEQLIERGLPDAGLPDIRELKIINDAD